MGATGRAHLIFLISFRSEWQQEFLRFMLPPFLRGCNFGLFPVASKYLKFTMVE